MFFGASAYYVGKHPRRQELKTAVYNEDIDNLIHDLSAKLGQFDPEAKGEIQNSLERTRWFKEMPSEVPISRLTFLRRMQVKTLGRGELEAVALSDLLDYKSIVGENEYFERYETEIKAVISEDNEYATGKLRAFVMSLREDIDHERFTIGIGEAILESTTHWSIFAAFSIFYLGSVALLGAPYFETSLTFVNWSLLGIAGAILERTIHIRNMDTYGVGDDEGNLVLRQMVLGIVLGAAAAVLAYVAIRNGLLSGRVLPALNSKVGPEQS